MNIQVYSNKSIVVYGKTYVQREILKMLGGRFNKFLNIDSKKIPGWIFFKKEHTIELLNNALQSNDEEDIIKFVLYQDFTFTTVKKKLYVTGNTYRHKLILSRLNGKYENKIWTFENIDEDILKNRIVEVLKNPHEGKSYKLNENYKY